jgi:preprotein translocase subunit YajC
MMILGGIVFLLILVMVFFISRQNAAQRQEIKQMELDAEAAA